MRVNFFNSLRHTNWEKVAYLTTAACGIWALWVFVVPSRLHTLVTAILGTLSFVVGLMTRGTRYVHNREEEK